MTTDARHAEMQAAIAAIDAAEHDDDTTEYIRLPPRHPNPAAPFTVGPVDRELIAQAVALAADAHRLP